jgi:hypothetical protein
VDYASFTRYLLPERIRTAALQDSRKDVLPFRDLFTYRIALRLAEDSHVDMVLGDGALDRGAACHLIPATLPGIGFVHVEGAHEPVRVRLSYISDDDITDMADRWPALGPDGGAAQVIDLTDPRSARHPRTGGRGPGLTSTSSPDTRSSDPVMPSTHRVTDCSGTHSDHDAPAFAPHSVTEGVTRQQASNHQGQTQERKPDPNTNHPLDPNTHVVHGRERRPFS